MLNQLTRPLQNKYSRTFLPPPDAGKFNGNLQLKTISEKQVAMMNRHISSVVFPNSNYCLQYLHGMTPVMDAGDLKHISGSLYDSVDSLVGTAKLDPAVLGYSMLICKKSLVPAGSMIGEVLTEEHLKNTSHEGKNETDLVLRSVPLIFFVPMTWDHITGDIRDSDVVDSFSALAGNTDDPMDWINSIL